MDFRSHFGLKILPFWPPPIRRHLLDTVWRHFDNVIDPDLRSMVEFDLGTILPSRSLARTPKFVGFRHESDPLICRLSMGRTKIFKNFLPKNLLSAGLKISIVSVTSYRPRAVGP